MKSVLRTGHAKIQSPPRPQGGSGFFRIYGGKKKEKKNKINLEIKNKSCIFDY